MEELVAEHISNLAKENCLDDIKHINFAETTLEKAIQCIVRLPNRPLRGWEVTSESILKSLMKYDEVVEALKIWRGNAQETVFDLFSKNVFCLRTGIKRINEEKFQSLARELIFASPYRPWDVDQLIPDLELTAEDKKKCEKSWRQVSNRTWSSITDPTICKIWLQAAKKFPSCNDLEVATQMIIVEIQQHDVSYLLRDLLKLYPNVNSNRIVSEIRKWPGPHAGLAITEIRKEHPYWILQGILGTTVQDCNYSWIRKQLKNNVDKQVDDGKSKLTSFEELPSDIMYYLVSHVSFREDRSFHLFEELPEDIIYYLMSHVSFREVLALSQTNKRMLKLVNASQHTWTLLGNKYFTKIPITNAADFKHRYKSKFRTGKLVHHFPTRNSEYPVSSIELNGQQIISSELNGMISIIDTHCLEPTTKGIKRKTTRYVDIQSAAIHRAARLFSGYIYALSIKSEAIPSTLTIVDLKKTSEKTEIQCPTLGKHQIYFTIDQNSLLGVGFAMDLTTQQITVQNWSNYLTRWLIRDDIIYGMPDYGLLGRYTTYRLGLFDRRTPENSAGDLRCENLLSFNVKDNDIYTVSSHVKQWDKRYLSRPVRKSRDPYFHYTKDKCAGYPAIDLTSMTVIGSDQIWDLTDFTWQLADIAIEKNRIMTNGILVAYTYSESSNVRQLPCTRGLTGPLVTHTELQC